MYAARTPPRLGTLVLLTGMSVLSLNMFLPSLSNMAVDFETDYSIVALAIAGYLGITGILMLIAGPMSDRFGRRPVLLGGVTIFTLASLVCVFTTDIWVFLAFRVCQGAIVSGWAISLACIRDQYPPQEAASKIGYVTMAMAVAPMLGPMFGGLLDEFFGWRANFVAYAALGVFAFVLCWIDLGETNTSPSETFSKQFRAYPELFRSRRFWGYAVCGATATGTFYVFLTGAPLVAVTLLGMSPAELGFYMGTITSGYMLGSFLSGRYAQRFQLTSMIISGRVVGNLGILISLLLFAVGNSHVVALFGPLVLVGLGNGLTMPSCNAGILSVRPSLAGSAAGLAGALAISFGAVLTTTTGLVVTEENGAYGLLFVMLACTATSLIASLYVLKLDRKEIKSVAPS